MIISGRTAIIVAAFFAIILLASTVWASVHAPIPTRTYIEPCALVLNRGGQQECR